LTRPNYGYVPAAGSGTVSDATTGAKGVLQLAGDLGGTATAPTVPGLAGKVGKGDLVLNVKDYGAVGNGTADDAAAIQAAIDASVGGTVAGGAAVTRSAVKPVYLPRGTYKITAPLKVYSVAGFHLFGDGEETFLSVSGALTYALDINGSYVGQFRDFTIKGATATDTVTSAIGMNWDNTLSSRSTTGNTLRNIMVRNLKYVNAFALGDATAGRQMDNVQVDHCFAQGQWTAGETTWWQVGFMSGNGTSGNVLNHGYNDCHPSANRYNYSANGTNVNIIGGDVGAAEVDVRHVGAHHVNLQGIRSEQSQRLFEQAGGASYPSVVALRDILFEAGMLNADGRFIKIGYSGAVTLENIRVGQQAASPVIYVSNAATRSAQVTATGLLTRSAVSSLFVSAGTTTPVSVVVVNYSQLDSSGLVTDRVPIWTKNFQTATSTQVPTFTDGVIVGGSSLQMADVSAPPSAPTSGGVLYAHGGTLRFVGSSGTITTIAPA